jgi:hypothetical protein
VKVHSCLVTRSEKMFGDVEVKFLSFVTRAIGRLAGLLAPK